MGLGTTQSIGLWCLEGVAEAWVRLVRGGDTVEFTQPPPRHLRLWLQSQCRLPRSLPVLAQGRGWWEEGQGHSGL